MNDELRHNYLKRTEKQRTAREQEFAHSAIEKATAVWDSPEGSRMTTKGKAKVIEDKAGEFRWQLKAANGEILATGEGHTRKEDAERAFTTVFGVSIDEWEGDVVDEGPVEQ